MGEGSALFHVDRGRRTVHAKETCVPVAFQYYEEEKREGDVFVFMGEGMRGGVHLEGHMVSPGGSGHT